MYKLIVSILLFVFAASAQHNIKQTLFKINDFKADSLKYTPVFNLSDYENIKLSLRINDTSAAGFASDSVNCYWGIQYGEVTVNYADVKDTEWVNPMFVVDSCRFDAANFVTSTSTSTSDTLDPLAICTTYVSGLAIQSRMYQPYRMPIARLWIKGVTGNELTSFLRTQFLVTQCKYSRVDIGQTNQPDD